MKTTILSLVSVTQVDRVPELASKRAQTSDWLLTAMAGCKTHVCDASVKDSVEEAKLSVLVDFTTRALEQGFNLGNFELCFVKQDTDAVGGFSSNLRAFVDAGTLLGDAAEPAPTMVKVRLCGAIEQPESCQPKAKKPGSWKKPYLELKQEQAFKIEFQTLTAERAAGQDPLVSLLTFARLAKRSRASVYRDIALGVLPPFTKRGHKSFLKYSVLETYLA